MKATKAQVEARVNEVIRIRLDGAEIWDLRNYVREKEQEAGSPWQLAEGQRPLSDSQLWRYLAEADKRLAESCRASRKRLLRRHLARRRNLYTRALAQGDIRAALAAARDECELLGLYPSPDHELREEVKRLQRMVVEAEEARRAPGGASNGNGFGQGDNPGAGGAGAGPVPAEPPPAGELGRIP
jgi:hypothetical protein